MCTQCCYQTAKIGANLFPILFISAKKFPDPKTPHKGRRSDFTLNLLRAFSAFYATFQKSRESEDDKYLKPIKKRCMRMRRPAISSSPWQQRSKRESTALAAQQSSNNARAAQGVPRMKISRAYFFIRSIFSLSLLAGIGTQATLNTQMKLVECSKSREREAKARVSNTFADQTDTRAANQTHNPGPVIHP